MIVRVSPSDESMKSMKIIDPLKEFRESLKSIELRNPVKEHLESLKGMHYQDPIQKLRESLQGIELRNPVKEYRESLKALQYQDPIKSLQESLKGIELRDPVKEYRESLKALHYQDPIKKFQESLKGIELRDPVTEYRESLKALHYQDPIKNLRESLKTIELRDLLKEYRESLRVIQMYDPMREFRESLLITQARDLAKEFSRNMLAVRRNSPVSVTAKALSDERWTIEAEDISNIYFNEEGCVSFGGKTVALEVLQEAAIDLFNSASGGTSDAIEVRLDRIIEKVDQPKDPFLNRLLQWLVYPLMVGIALSVVNPVADYYIKRHLSAGERKEVVKEVSRSLLSAPIEKTVLSTLKIVSTEKLNVRSGGAMSFPVIGSLYIGDIVEVKDRGRKWSLVEWRDAEEGAIIRGWVYSRHLKAIRKVP